MFGYRERQHTACSVRLIQCRAVGGHDEKPDDDTIEEEGVEFAGTCALGSTDLVSHDEKNWADDRLVLNCTAHQLVDAAITKGNGRALFQFCCETLTESELAGLDQAVRTCNDVCLLFPDEKVCLSEIQIDRLDGRWVRIVGRVDAS